MTSLPLAPGTARHGPPSNKRLVAYRRRLHSQREQRLDTLADLLAAGWTISAAAREMQVARQTASALFKTMCERLGDQAK